MSDVNVNPDLLPEPEPKQPWMSNAAYDLLKWMAMIALPALGTFYYALSVLWGFPNPDKVVGTIVAFNTLLGVLLGLSTRSYNSSEARYDGSMNVEQRPDGVKTLTLAINSDPEQFENMKQVVFKVNKQLV